MSDGLRTASSTDVGRVRDRNEDAIFCGENVFAVADGLGGHRAGEVASSLALEPIAALDQAAPREAARRLADAVKRSNLSVFERSQGQDELKGMGTTLTAVVVAEGTAHLAHVGDSRCYLIRGAGITRISRDHTLVARMVDEGKLTPEQAESHPQRSILTRALGAEPTVDVEEIRVPLVAGDRLLLCSDGLTGVVGDDELHAIISDGSDLDEISQRLIDEANERGGHDNISVVLVDVGGSIAQARAAGRLPWRRRESARRFPVRPVTWAAALALILGVGYLGVTSWVDRSYYVGVTEEGTVAIFRGIPANVPGLSRLEEPTELDVDEVSNPAVRRSLQEGVRQPTLGEARAYVEQLLRDAGIGMTPESDPTASASPSVRGSP
ncbi:MAG TPA: Stp1/IreP family PP2C-type Ser/Thr phosphatase [Actinomycetota bacterium]